MRSTFLSPLYRTFERTTIPHNALLITLTAGLGCLAFAFIMQYGFDVLPCKLCLVQRVPFGIVAFIAALALVLRPKPSALWIFLSLITVVFFINAGVAAFHTGVERHWWQWESECTITPLAQTGGDLLSRIRATRPARCDEISWTLLGLSMANYNIALSLILGLHSAFAAIRARKQK